MSDTPTPTPTPTPTRRTPGAVKGALKGVGKESPVIAALAGIGVQSLNHRLGLGMSPQELMAVTAAVIILGVRLKTWLEKEGIT